MRLIAVVLLGSVVGCLGVQKSVEARDAAMSASWPLAGSGGWDYLTTDAPSHRLYVSRADHVDVVDTQTGQVAATIADTQGVHGIAIAPELNRGYISNGRGNSISEFDLKTNQRVKDVAIEGQNPDAILYESSTQQVYTFNGKSKDVTVLDAKTMTVKATIPVPGKPEFAQSDEHGFVYVNIETEPGQLVKINSKTLKVEATWPLTGCNSPTGLAIDRHGMRLFSVCDDKVMAVTDARSGAVVAKVTIGNGPDAVAYDAKTHRVFVSNGQGTLSIVAQKDPNHYEALPELTTERGARTLAFDELTGDVFEITAQFAPVAPTAAQPKPRPAVVPDSIHVLVIHTR